VNSATLWCDFDASWTARGRSRHQQPPPAGRLIARAACLRRHSHTPAPLTSLKSTLGAETERSYTPPRRARHTVHEHMNLTSDKNSGSTSDQTSLRRVRTHHGASTYGAGLSFDPQHQRGPTKTERTASGCTGHVPLCSCKKK
jgi:hypothetical protein